MYAAGLSSRICRFDSVYSDFKRRICKCKLGKFNVGITSRNTHRIYIYSDFGIFIEIAPDEEAKSSA